MLSERENIIDYLSGRVIAAWQRGDDVEAAQCARFLEDLEGMTDAEFDETYDETPALS